MQLELPPSGMRQDSSGTQSDHSSSIVERTLNSHKDSLRMIALKIHEYQELAFQEFKSAALLCSFLEKNGFHVQRGIAGMETAFLATFAKKGSLQTSNAMPDDVVVSFNAEYDALPELGHGCGHNLIAACAVGAGLAVKAWLEELPHRNGTVKIFGTPGEETTGGKVELIKAGFYKDVDISIMAHPSIFDGCFLPTVACHSFTVEYFGKAAHASIAPWDGINALDAMVEAYNGLNALRQSLRPSMRIAGSILEGGKYDNLIPDYSKGLFSFRASKMEDLKVLMDLVHNRFQAAALSTGCKLKITENMTYKDVNVNVPLALRYEAYASGLGIQFPSRKDQENLMACASTDQGNVSYEIPAIQAVYKIETPSGEANHTPEFTKAAKSEQAFEQTILSTKGLAYVAIDYLTQPDFREAVLQDFQRTVKTE